MRGTAKWIAAALVVIALAGCKTQSVSRTYKANMDATWDAVLAVAEKVSKDAPKADKQARRIVTGVVSTGLRDESGTGETKIRQSGSMWRGIITLSPEYGGTKVTIKVEKLGSESSADFTVTEEKRANVGLTLWSNNTDWQRKLLDEIAAELAAKSSVTSGP